MPVFDRSGAVIKLALHAPNGYAPKAYGERKSESDSSRYTFPPEPLSVQELRAAIPDLKFTDDLKGWYNGFVDWFYESERQKRKSSSPPAHEGPEPRREFQLEGINWLPWAKRGLLGDQPGLGKTNQLATAIDYSRPVLIAALGESLEQWRDEIDMWMGIESVIIEGERPQREHLLRLQPKVMLINHEMLRTKYWPNVFARRYGTLIIDEVHKFQGRDSLMTAGARAIATTPGTEYVWLATGSPIWNNPDSLWQLLNLIAPKRFTSYWTFAEYFCQIDYTQWGMTIAGANTQRIPLLQQVLAPLMLRRLKTDPRIAKELPAIQKPIIYHYELSPPQRRQYKDARRNAGDYEGQVTTLSTLRSICNLPHLHGCNTDPKAKLFLDVMAQFEGHQVVVFTWHVAVAHHVAKLLGTEAVVAAGVGDEWVAKFRKGEVKHIVGTIASMGTSHNLHDAGCCIVVFYEEDFVPTMNEQARQRVEQRMGQKNVTSVYHLIGRNTKEQSIHNISTRRKDVADQITAVRLIWEEAE